MAKSGMGKSSGYNMKQSMSGDMNSSEFNGTNTNFRKRENTQFSDFKEVDRSDMVKYL